MKVFNMPTGLVRDEKWLEDATLAELQQAIREELPESDLFQGELGKRFWDTYRAKVEQVYGGEKFQ